MNQQELEILQGIIEAVVFQNYDNGYAVLRLRLPDRQTVTVVGTIPLPVAGERLMVTGKWSTHSSYGRQFEAEFLERLMPQSAAEIVTYLSGRVIKGIGPKMANRIVSRFGDQTLAIMEREPERLAEISGISDKRAQEIGEEFRLQVGMRHLMEFFNLHHLPTELAVKTYKRYGESTIDLLYDDPYLLMDEELEAPFGAVDRFAIDMGVSADDPRRIAAGVLFELRYNLSAGHSFLPESKLIAATAQLLDVDSASVEKSIQQLLETECLFRDRLASIDVLYLPALHQAEAYCTRRLLGHTATRYPAPAFLAKKLRQAAQSSDFAYSSQQELALQEAATSGLLLITGGPGTGKTSVQRALLDLYRKRYPEAKIVCCAPTGKAARRMEQATGVPSSTVHRALGLLANEDGLYSEPEMIDADLVLVDEVSMLDIYLAEKLFRSVPANARLILVGDSDQLPSVGPGAVLKEIIASGMVPVVRLDQVFRQKNGSRIAANAKLIRHGNLSLEYGPDFEFHDSTDLSVSAEIIESLYLQETAKYGIDNVVLLSPYRQKTETGANALNQRLQAKVNPPAEGKSDAVHGQRRFRTGDKVMQIKNCEDISNGDVGYIKSISGTQTDSVVRIDFGDGRVVEYENGDLDMLDLGYACTVHKSQGSEYKSVIINLQCAHSVMLVRPLIYTAITRAKEKVLIVGERKALCTAIRRTDSEQRGTKLAQRIIEYKK